MGRTTAALLALATFGLLPAILPASASTTQQRTTAAVAVGADPTVVSDWNATAVTTIVSGGKGPAGYVYLGFVQAAVYDAVTAIEGGYRPYKLHLIAPADASPEAAAASAAHDVLITYFPAQKMSLDQALVASLARVPAGQPKSDGVAVGEQAAAGIVGLRLFDGRDAPITFTPAPAIGVWQPTPPAFAPAAVPWLAAVEPLMLQSPSQFRPPAPPRLTSKRYAKDYNEVKRVGRIDSAVRTPYETQVALFWTDNGVVQDNRAFRAWLASKPLSIEQAARSFAMLDMTAVDALIACWDAKYQYGFWRPITAIEQGGSDGNPRTAGDPTWTPVLPTANHPDYPSGHGCLTAANAATLATLAGTSRIDVTIASTVTGTTEHFATVRQLDREIVNARVWLGYHFRNSVRVAVGLGARVSHYDTSHYFQPLP